MQTFSQLLSKLDLFLSNAQWPEEIPQLYEPLSYFMTLPAKRVRPVSLLLSYQLFHENIEPALPLAKAIEWFHNFTLIHDDIMDQAPLRRGLPTVHEKYGQNTAILSGDVLLIKVYELIVDSIPSELLSQVMTCFNRVAIDVCEGQQLDMNYENISEVSKLEYTNMIRLKTAVLLGASIKMGAILAAAPSKDAENLYDFGTELGLAFQIQDDYLDVFGNPNKVGKQAGGDIIQCKKGAPFIAALDMLSGQEREKFISEYLDTSQAPAAKVKVVLDRLHGMGVEDTVNKWKQEHQDKAMHSLKNISFSEQQKLPLMQFAEMLLARES